MNCVRLKGMFAGSGFATMGEPSAARALVALTGKPPSAIHVVFIGAPWYDRAEAFEMQTRELRLLGCHIELCPLTDPVGIPPREKLVEMLSSADVVLVSGGNTVFGIECIKSEGLDVLLRECMDRGCVIAGGSAGAICWFQSGHSDSMDPTTFRNTPSTEQLLRNSNGDGGTALPTWQYIRVTGLGFLDGMIVPHHDTVGSNGIRRWEDVGRILNDHPTERAICLDHFAGLIVEGGQYRVFSVPERPGSVLPDGNFSPDRGGVPGVWISDIVDGNVTRTLVPPVGSLEQLLRSPASMVDDPMERRCRLLNPARPSALG